MRNFLSSSINNVTTHLNKSERNDDNCEKKTDDGKRLMVKVVRQAITDGSATYMYIQTLIIANKIEIIKNPIIKLIKFIQQRIAHNTLPSKPVFESSLH